ncbi:MAG: hypothetical protein IJL25_04585 [Clostridia bacterium]|nr:hypothetical protein [Clostridia bacterium]
MPSARRDAISAIGITLIENGRITNSYYTLVDPACPFDPFTVELTGITPEMAAAFPEFGDLWEQIRPWLEGALLCAHGASGDLHVLARTLRRYKIDWVEKAPFLCTVEAAKQCFPELERYSLNLACKALDIPLQHHLASSDAAAAAALLLRCMERDPSLPEHAKEFDMREARIVGVTKKRPRRKKSGAALNVETELKKLSSKTFAAARRVQYRDTGEELLGVKSKAVKRLAQRISRSKAAAAFSEDLPHTYLEEDLLHAYLLDMKPGFDACLAAVDAFLPLVENDDVFFALKPRALLRDPVRIEESCRGWIGSDHPYTVAFGIRMLAQAISPKTFDPDAFDRSLAEQIAGMHIDHPTVALAAADYFFRLLKYGGEENGAYIRGIAESCTAAKRGLYFYEKDQEALSLQEPAF